MQTNNNRLFDRGLLRHLTFARSAAIVAAMLVATLALGVPAPVCAAATRFAELPAAWVDDRGQPFDLRALYGRTVVLSMAYATCHRVCPLTIDHLRRLQSEFDQRGVQAEFLVIGYDPDADDVAAWRQYRRTRQLLRSNWHFLVGTRADVERVARQLGFEFWKMDQHVIHDGRIVRFDERGVLVASDAASGL
jgi:protein SCO1